MAILLCNKICLVIIFGMIVAIMIGYGALSNSNVYYLLSDAKQPTVDEVRLFLEKDKTDENIYINDSYNCVNFANDVINNAKKLNYRVGRVSLSGKHAIVCFDTLEGIYYVEPQNDNLYNQKQFDNMKGNKTYCMESFNCSFTYNIIFWK